MVNNNNNKWLIIKIRGPSKSWYPSLAHHRVHSIGLQLSDPAMHREVIEQQPVGINIANIDSVYQTIRDNMGPQVTIGRKGAQRHGWVGTLP